MEVILTHEQADFDAAASVLAAWLLDPSRIPVLPKRRNRNLAAFLEDQKTSLPFVTWKDVPKGTVSRVFLTDTQTFAPHPRLEKVKDVVVWDHHPCRCVYPDREENIYDSTGACTSFLVERRSVRPDIRLGKMFATLLMMGIYEDTGFLSYGSTTSRDIRAAAWLADHGADLDLMRRYILIPLTEHQQTACDLLMQRCESHEMQGKQILIAAADVREISDEFATVAHHLRDLLTPDGLILLLGTKSGIRVICRAMTDDIDFGSMMKKYNGGGHKRAASTMIPLEITDETDMSAALASLKEDMIKTMPEYILP